METIFECCTCYRCLVCTLYSYVPSIKPFTFIIAAFAGVQQRCTTTILSPPNEKPFCPTGTATNCYLVSTWVFCIEYNLHFPNARKHEIANKKMNLKLKCASVLLYNKYCNISSCTRTLQRRLRFAIFFVQHTES